MTDNSTTDQNRRAWIRASLMGLSLWPVGSLLLSKNALARGSRAVTGATSAVPRLPEIDSQAAALNYVEDAASADRTKYHIAEGSACRNCLLYSGAEGQKWGPCAIFSYRVDPLLNRNYVVSAKGWCRSWAPRGG